MLGCEIFAFGILLAGGIISSMRNVQIKFGLSWNQSLSEVREEISEAQARTILEEKELDKVLAIVVWLEHREIPFAQVEISASRRFHKVTFYDRFGSKEKVHNFDRENDRLFLATSLRYTYPPEEKFYWQNEHIGFVELKYQTSGVVQRIDDVKTNPTQRVTEYRDVDVQPNWEDIPEFGNWGSIMRRDRSKPALF